MKRLKVLVAGSKDESVLLLLPGITAGAILRKLKLKGYILYAVHDPNHIQSYVDRYTFKAKEDVYSKVQDGDTLCAIVASDHYGSVAKILYRHRYHRCLEENQTNTPNHLYQPGDNYYGQKTH